MTARLPTIAEAALIYLREAGGTASVARDGVVFVAARPAPFLFGAVEKLADAGLVALALPRDPGRGRLVATVTSEGEAYRAGLMAAQKARSWGRRYDD